MRKIPSLFLIVILATASGCSVAKLFSSGKLNTPLAQVGASLCEGKPDIAATAAKVASFGCASAADNAGVIEAVQAASGLLALIWPNVKTYLDGVGICSRDPDSDECRKTWMSAYPGALCGIVEACASAS